MSIVINGVEFKNAAGKAFKVYLSNYCINFSPVFVSDGMTGKMHGIPAISTDSRRNVLCELRKQLNNYICTRCFADRTAKAHKTLGQHLSENSELLTAEVLPLDSLPVFSSGLIVRLEAFGDISNVTQVINYFNICKSSPAARFAIWTKNPGYIAQAIKAGYKKPDNLRVVYSSSIINSPAPVDIVKRVFPFIDIIFTVYDAKTIEAQNININCGAKSCISCRNCYDKQNFNNIVNEKLK